MASPNEDIDISVYEEYANTRVYPVEVPDLLNWVVAKIPSEWENIGSLLKIEDEQLQAIKMNVSYGGDPRKHFKETLSLWQHGGSYEPFNWFTILKVLCAPFINKEPLAKEIADKLRKKVAGAPSQMSTPVLEEGGNNSQTPPDPPSGPSPDPTPAASYPVQEENGLTAQYAVQVLRECEFRMFTNWKNVATTLGVSLEHRKRLQQKGMMSGDYNDVMEEALVLWIDKGNATWEQLIDAVEREEKNTARRMRYLIRHDRQK